MKIKDLIRKLEEYPDDREVYVLGFRQPCSTSWESWHSSKIIFNDDPAGLEIEGDLE